MPRKPSLDSLRIALGKLTLEQKQALYQWLGEAIAAEQAEQIEIPPQEGRAVTETRRYEGKTYQREKRRCGRVGCRCMDGEVSDVGHGPYWYAYWKEKRKLRNQYIGKRAPWEAVPGSD